LRTKEQETRLILQEHDYDDDDDDDDFDVTVTSTSNVFRGDGVTEPKHVGALLM
jgi:hypothetical protein